MGKKPRSLCVHKLETIVGDAWSPTSKKYREDNKSDSIGKTKTQIGHVRNKTYNVKVKILTLNQEITKIKNNSKRIED